MQRLPNDAFLLCSECGGLHMVVDPQFDGFQWWDHCVAGCGFTPHGYLSAGLEGEQCMPDQGEPTLRPASEL